MNREKCCTHSEGNAGPRVVCRVDYGRTSRLVVLCQSVGQLSVEIKRKSAKSLNIETEPSVRRLLNGQLLTSVPALPRPPAPLWDLALFLFRTRVLPWHRSTKTFGGSFIASTTTTKTSVSSVQQKIVA